MINTKNTSGIFMKDFNFIDLLGDIRYDDDGKIIGKLNIGLQKYPLFQLDILSGFAAMLENSIKIPAKFFPTIYMFLVSFSFLTLSRLLDKK